MRRLGVVAAYVDGSLVHGDVAVADGCVEAVGLPPGGRGLAVPGMVDLQVNGYAGIDFLTAPPEAWAVAGAAMARDGVTAYVANLITSPVDDLAAGARAASVAAAGTAGAARCLGVHLEGPFLSPVRRGTHPLEDLRPPGRALLDEIAAAGPVVGMTIAPELPGAIELIATLSSRGVLVALGHSDATAEQAHAAFDAGARTVTHVFNGMSTPTARAPGLAGVALARDDVAVQLICDGEHLAPETVALVVSAAPARFVLVTDALSAAAAPDGDYRLGAIALTKVDGRARNADGALAGSVASLPEAVRCAVRAGAAVEDALAAVTTRPADLLGRSDLPRLRPGDRADIAVLDDRLEVTAVFVAGDPTT